MTSTGDSAQHHPGQGQAGTTFPRECAGFVAGRGFRLEGMLGGYAFRSPTDLRVVAADEAGTSVVTLGDELTVWDAASGGRRAAHAWSGDALATARDGRTAAVGQRTGAVALVDLTSGAALWSASVVQGDEGSLKRGIQPPVQYLAMAGGVVAAIVETGETVHVLRDGHVVARFAGEGPLALSPDGSLLVAGPRVHDLITGEVVLTFEPGVPSAQVGARHRTSFSRDGMRLAHTDPGGGVDLWNVPSLRARHGVNARLFSATMPVAPWDRQGRCEPAAAVFLLDDGTVVTSTGSALQVWSGGAIVRTIPFHADTVCLGAGASTWGVRRQRSIVNVDIGTGTSAGQDGHLAEVKTIAHSPRAPLALTGGGDARVLLWHLPSCTVLRELPDAWGTIEGAIFFPDGRRVAAIDTERMFVWDAATRELVSKLDRVSPRESGLRQNLDLDASPDGKHALVCTYSDHVLLWDAEAQRTVYTREVEGVRSAAFGPAPSIAILGSWKELLVFDLARGEPVRHIEVEHDSAGHRAHLVFDQGRRAVRPCSGRGLFVYDLETSQRSLVPVTDDVHHLLALSPDGAVAAISTSDDPIAGTPLLRPEVALVRVQGGARTTISLATADDRPACASFSGDGATLLVGTARGVVLRFALDVEVASQAHPGRAAVAAAVPTSGVPAGAPASMTPSSATPASGTPAVASGRSSLGETRPAGPISSAASAPAAAPDEVATRVMSAFPDMRGTTASGTPSVSSQPQPPVSHAPATAPSPGERVIVAPPRVPSVEDEPLSSFHPLGATSPRAGVGPSSAKPGTLEAKREEAIGILRRVGALYARGAYNEALAFAAPLRRHLFDSFPPGDPLVAAAVANLAELHTKVGELKEAEALHQEALERIPRTAGESSEAFATTLSNAGNFALEVRDLARAEQLHRRALDIRRVLHGDRHPLTAQSTSSLGFVLARLGRSDLAEPLYRAAIDAFRATVGATHPEHAKTLHNLGVLVGQAGRFQESETMLVESLATRRAVLADGHLDVAQGLASLGTLYLVSKRPAQAEPLYREALELSRRSLGDAAVETSTRAVDLAVALRALGRPAEALPLLHRALEVRLAKLAPDDARVANVRRMLAELA